MTKSELMKMVETFADNDNIDVAKLIEEDREKHYTVCYAVYRSETVVAKTFEQAEEFIPDDAIIHDCDEWEITMIQCEETKEVHFV